MSTASRIAEYEREAMHQYRMQQTGADNTGTPTPAGVHWSAFIPFVSALLAWVMWLLFLLMPTAFSFHYAGMFPAVSNWLYVAMGLTLCLAASVAAWFQHGIHAIGFTFAVLLLSYWIF